MAARYTAMQQHPNCCSNFAAACTSARLGLILDTVILIESLTNQHGCFPEFRGRHPFCFSLDSPV